VIRTIWREKEKGVVEKTEGCPDCVGAPKRSLLLHQQIPGSRIKMTNAERANIVDRKIDRTSEPGVNHVYHKRSRTYFV
jgi:hypothetical protein